MSEGDENVNLDDSPNAYAGGSSGNGVSFGSYSDGVIDLRENSEEAVTTDFADTPAVMALVVVEQDDERFYDVLTAMADQTYDNLSVTILNATGIAEMPERIQHACPFGEWVTMDPGTGFAELANWALTNVDPVAFPFLVIVDQFTALAPAGLSYLLEEMYRSNAGIVGPKLVGWDDGSKLISVGYGSDRRGRRIELIEPDEFDQDQYGGVSDVFIIPTGVQLIRTDLFVALDGFDPLMGDDNEDLDLCWRAHAVAARVIVVPQAAARHRRPVLSKSAELQRYRQRSRHRLRTLFVTSSRLSLLRSTAGTVAGMVLGAIANLLRGRPGYAKAALTAIGWNVRNIGSARRRRRHLRSIRLVGDSEVHALQSRIGPSVGSIVEQSLRPSARFAHWSRSVRQSLADERQRIGSAVVGFLGVTLVLILMGSFGLLGQAPVVVGQNPVLGDGQDLLLQWWNGFRPSGAGGIGAAPVSFAVLGLLEIGLSWSSNLLYSVLLVGPLFVAALGTFRMVRPLGGPRSAAVATAVAVANPLTAEAFAAARWEALVLWAAAPFFVISAARLANLEPWNAVERVLPVRLLRFGLLVALVATLAPAALPLGVLAALCVSVFGVVTGRVYRIGYGLAGAAAAVVVPAVMHLQFSLDVLRGSGWGWIVGTASAEEAVGGFGELVLFAPGRSTGSILMWGLPIAASLGLLFGRGRRFDAALLGWIMGIMGFGAAWLSIDLVGNNLLPGADVLLTLAGAGLALAVGASVRSVQIDLKRYGYGWRQFATVTAALGGVVVLLLGFGQALGGRHNHPELGYAEITTRLEPRYSGGPSRILWLGDPRVLAADTALTPAGEISYAITDGGGTDIGDRFLPAVSPISREVGVMIDVANSGDSVRLGRLLAVFGIDYVIYQPQLAPAPYEGPSYDISDHLNTVLANQLDLRRQQATLNLIVFSNEASHGSAVVVDSSFDANTVTLTGLLDTDLSGGMGIVPDSSTAIERRFEPNPGIAVGDRILLALPGEGWESFGGVGPIETTIGGASLIEVLDPGQSFGVRYATPRFAGLWHGLQLALILAAWYFASRTIASTKTPESNPGPTVDLRATLASERAQPFEEENPFVTVDDASMGGVR